MLNTLTCRLAILCLSGSALSWASPMMYTAVDLGILNLPGGYTGKPTLTGINDSGQVVGYVPHSSGIGFQSFLYTSDTGLVELGSLPGGENYTRAFAINTTGQVVGASNNQAFLRSDTGMVGLGFLPGTTRSGARAINNNGQVAGTSWQEGIKNEAFLYSPGTGMVGLGYLPGAIPGRGTSSGAADVNDRGEVVGSATVQYLEEAFLYTPEGGMTGLGFLPGAWTSYGVAINNRGEVIGESTRTPYETEAFLYRPGVGMTGLGFLPGGTSSYARDINDSGQIVGWGSSSASGGAFFYSNGVMYDLNSLITNDGIRLYEATAINNAGQIIAIGSGNHVYLLTATPEPGSWLLFSAGLLGLLVLTRKRSFLQGVVQQDRHLAQIWIERTQD